MLNGNERLYLYHELLRHLGLFVFYSFGALLFYEITGSMVEVFIIGLAYFGSGVVTRSAFVPFFVWLKRKIGVVGVMGIGLAVMASVNALLFVTETLGSASLALLVILMFISSVGSGMYWIFSNIVKLDCIGHAHRPGSYSSYLVIARILAAIISSAAGIVLSFQDHFIGVFILSSFLLFVSLIPLFMMKGIEHRRAFQFKRVFRRIPTFTLLANTRMTPELVNYGIPLFLLLTFVSVPKSVLITGASYIVAAVLSYFVGKYKDHGDNRLILVAAILVVVCFLVFSQIQSVASFVIVIALLSVGIKALRVGEGARLGCEIVQSKNELEFMVGLEIMRNIGSTLTLAVLLLIYLVFNELPQAMFVLGVLFILPQALYSIGWFGKKVH